MVQNAKILAQNPRDPQAVGGWRAANQQVGVIATDIGGYSLPLVVLVIVNMVIDTDGFHFIFIFDTFQNRIEAVCIQFRGQPYT